MKLMPWHRDPNETIETLEPTDEAAETYGHLYGSDLIILSAAHIEALEAGKMLAWNDSEYSTFLILKPGEAVG